MATTYVRSRLWLAAGIFLAMAGCAAPVHQDGEEASSVSSALTWTDGTLTMDVDASADPIHCVGADPTLDVSGVITAIGDGDIHAVATLLDVDGFDLATITIATGADFIDVGGGTRVAGFAASQVVPNGLHAVEMCFALADSHGVSSIQACMPVFEYELDCSAPSDTTPPTIVGSRAPAANGAGWNNTDVTVSFMCEDFESGVASCSSPVVLSSEGAGQSASGMAMDNAGNSASTTVSGINIDKTAPDVSLSGTGSYTVDQNVSVTCSANDTLSGVASSTCNGASGPAYSFGVGSHAVSASASDNAGNGASASGSFSVSVTGDSLCNLVHQFVSKPGVANSLCQKLDAAEAAKNRGRTLTARLIMIAFDLELWALKGKAITVANAAILKDLGQAFIPHGF